MNLSSIVPALESKDNQKRLKRRKGTSRKSRRELDPSSVCIVCILLVIVVAFLSWVSGDSSSSSSSSNGNKNSSSSIKASIKTSSNTIKNNISNKISTGKNAVAANLSRLRGKNANNQQLPRIVTNINQLEYEKIIHPGDKKTPLIVPKFYSKPIHNNRLMTKEEAMSIGTCLSEKDKELQIIGEECPLDDRTIFLSIASYRDYECRTTVENAFARAKYPHRIRIAIIDQIHIGEDVNCNDPLKPCIEDPTQMLCLYKDQIEVYNMHASLSVGPVFARHIGYRFYRGEYYAAQSDAHVTYTQGWDVDIIDQFLSANNEMAVLSTYLSDVGGAINSQGHSLTKTRPIICNTIFEDPQGKHLRHDVQPEKEPSIKGQPQLSPWWAAGFSFSRGHFVVNVPYDQYAPMIFMGEEMSMGIRGFTVGYDYYAPERSVCFHHYVKKSPPDGQKDRRAGKHLFWDNTKFYEGVGTKSMTRLLGIVHQNPEVPKEDWDHTDEDIYGIGGVRTPEKFYETFGIDVVKKEIHNLCPFVDEWTNPNGGHMHKMFTKHLRSDGMGIDYDKINFQYKPGMAFPE